MIYQQKVFIVVALRLFTAPLLNYIVVAALSSVEQQDIVNLHNSLRRNEGASNMQVIVSHFYVSRWL
jgi:hypothetical protein